MRKFITRMLFFISLMLFSQPAYANIGVPMIFITMPGMVIGLIPIILIEAYVLMEKLSMPFKQAIKTSAIINGFSTILGMPLTWLFLVLIQMFTGGGGAHGLHTPLQKFLAVTWQAPWLIPYESDLDWMVPAATLVLLIPFFFASWLIEWQIAKRFLKQTDAGSLKRTVLSANLASYALLFTITLVWFVGALIKHPA